MTYQRASLNVGQEEHLSLGLGIVHPSGARASRSIGLNFTITRQGPPDRPFPHTHQYRSGAGRSAFVIGLGDDPGSGPSGRILAAQPHRQNQTSFPSTRNLTGSPSRMIFRTVEFQNRPGRPGRSPRTVEGKAKKLYVPRKLSFVTHLPKTVATATNKAKPRLNLAGTKSVDNIFSGAAEAREEFPDWKQGPTPAIEEVQGLHTPGRDLPGVGRAAGGRVWRRKNVSAVGHAEEGCPRAGVSSR